MVRPKHTLLIATSALILIGVMMVYSSSAIYAWRYFGSSYFFLRKAFIFVLIGFAGMTAAVNIDYHFLQKQSKKILLLSIFLLVLTFISPFCRAAGGAKRWLILLPWGYFKNFSFQPSELAKFSLILYLSSFFSRRQIEIKDFWRGFSPPLLITLLVASLVFIQPDLGTTFLLFCLFFIIAFSAGAKLKHLLSLFFSSLILAPFLILIRPYWIKRITSFLHPFRDPEGAGWQIIQSFIAFKNGGLWGIGLGASRQKLFYLPGCHTDFIFSIIGEELGLLGSTAVIFLFVLLIASGIRIALGAKDLAGHLLALGITMLIGLQVVINIAVVTALIPTKGLPLPFISYGGSALIFNMLGIGILVNIANNSTNFNE